MDKVCIFWHRRDLRNFDNAGLYHALKNHKNVLPVFIFDTEILDKLEDKNDARVTFIHSELAKLKLSYEQQGSSLSVLHGSPENVWKKLTAEYSIEAVYCNRDYEPYAQERDKKIYDLLAAKGIPFKGYKDHVVFEKTEVTKDDGKPYTVFTPYSKRWKNLLNSFYLKPYPVHKYLGNLYKVTPLLFPALSDINFVASKINFPNTTIDINIISKYAQQRDFPAINGTSKLSIHLRFGTISIRQLANTALTTNEKFLNELIWRDFYQMILFHFPYTIHSAFKPIYDNVQWDNNPDHFERWCNGTTGYPIVDAGMRELNTTGYMHNRVRMIVASFLTKHLLIDWRWGEAYFAQKLLDYDLASNIGGWQWAASCGCDAAPYFRVFNPELQTLKFDKDLKYIKHWIPELNTTEYPAPVVNHQFARERILRAYKFALKNE